MTRMWKGESAGARTQLSLKQVSGAASPTSGSNCTAPAPAAVDGLIGASGCGGTATTRGFLGASRFVSGSHFYLTGRPGTRGACPAGVIGRQQYLLAGDEQIPGRLSSRNPAAPAPALLPVPSPWPWHPPRSSGTGVCCVIFYCSREEGIGVYLGGESSC